VQELQQVESKDVSSGQRGGKCSRLECGLWRQEGHGARLTCFSLSFHVSNLSSVPSSFSHPITNMPSCREMGQCHLFGDSARAPASFRRRAKLGPAPRATQPVPGASGRNRRALRVLSVEERPRVAVGPPGVERQGQGAPRRGTQRRRSSFTHASLTQRPLLFFFPASVCSRS
jgi:hypothetical protein